MTRVDAPVASSRSERSTTGDYGQPPQRSASHRSDSARTTNRSLGQTTVAVELSLIALTVVTVWSCGRLLKPPYPVGKLLAVAIASHLVAIAMRRLQISRVVSLLVGLALGWLVIGYVFESHTLTAGLPLNQTASTISSQLKQAWDTYQKELAPVPSQPGFIVLLAAAGWILGQISDSLALRARLGIEAPFPAFTLFGFASIVGDPEAPHVLPAALFLCALLAFFISHRLRTRALASPLTTYEGGGSIATLLGAGAVLVLVGTVAAVASASLVPERDPLINWRDKGEQDSSRVTVSPLVTIRHRLVNQSTLLAFTVTASQPAYWRLTSLNSFDGTVWGSSDSSYKSANGDLPGNPKGSVLTQHYQIAALDSIWLPGAYFPTRIDAPDSAGTSFSSDSGSITTRLDTADGLIYDVESIPTEIGPDQLNAASSAIPKDVAERYLQLPNDFPSQLRDEALRVTAGTSTRYQAARALQDYFRNNFTYSLEQPSGHTDDDMANFIFTTKSGYCEQFSASYAALARSVGIPARVAVGFTTGDIDNGAYRVLGRHAHAWPEVYFEGFGWISFEPTPGRGIPGAESYTGAAASQAAPDSPQDANPIGAATSSTSLVGQQAASISTSVGNSTTSTSTDQNQAPATQTVPHKANRLVPLAIIALLLALWLIGLPILRNVIIAKRRSAAKSNDHKILVSWAEATEALSSSNPPHEGAETAIEYSQRVSVGNQGAKEKVSQLAVLASKAGFSNNIASTHDAQVAADLASEIESTSGQEISKTKRVLRRLNPRDLPSLIRSARSFRG